MDPIQIQIEAVRAKIKWEQVYEVASSIKGKPCTIEDKEFSGGCNVIYPLVFEDGARWALRVPHDDIDVRSTVNTMEYVKRTLPSIPIATVYAWSDSEDGNGIGAPYILMDWIEGSTLTWNETFPPPEARTKVLAQLARFSADLLLGTTEQSDTETTSALAWTLKRIDSRLRRIFNGEMSSFDPIDCLIYRTMAQEKYIVASLNNLPFPLVHTDLAARNLVVDEEFNIVGILDWDDWARRLPLQYAILYPDLVAPGDNELPFDFMRFRDRFTFYTHFYSSIQHPFLSSGSDNLPIGNLTAQMLPILANDELQAFHSSVTSKGAYLYWLNKYLPSSKSSDPQATAAAVRGLEAFLHSAPEMAAKAEVISVRARLCPEVVYSGNPLDSDYEALETVKS